MGQQMGGYVAAPAMMQGMNVMPAPSVTPAEPTEPVKETVEELQDNNLELSEDAKAAGMNESKYLRELIIHGGVDITHAEDRRNLIRQISGIATNINQMAKHCNESKWLGNVDALKMTRALEEVIKLMKQLVERWR